MSLTNLAINGVSYLGYASVDEADLHFAVDPVRGSAWLALTDIQKSINIVSATRRIDLEDAPGLKTDPAQLAAYPRAGIVCDGVPVPENEVPLPVVNATIVLAGSLPSDASVTSAGSGGGASSAYILRVKAGSAEVEFATGEQIQKTSFSLAVRAPDAFALLRCILDGSSSNVGYGSASGTGAQSGFVDAEAPRLTQGLS